MFALFWNLMNVSQLQVKYWTYVCGDVRPVGMECAGRPGFSLISTIFGQ